MHQINNNLYNLKKMKKVVLSLAIVAALVSCKKGEEAAATDSAAATVDSAVTETVDSAATVVDSAAAVVDSAAAKVEEGAAKVEEAVKEEVKK